MPARGALRNAFVPGASGHSRAPDHDPRGFRCHQSGIHHSLNYSNSDLAPVPPLERHWGLKDFAALWISMSACIPTYTLASSLIEEGMSWWQALAVIFLGNLIVLLPMVLNSHAGT